MDSLLSFFSHLKFNHHSTKNKNIFIKKCRPKKRLIIKIKIQLLTLHIYGWWRHGPLYIIVPPDSTGRLFHHRIVVSDPPHLGQPEGTGWRAQSDKILPRAPTWAPSGKGQLRLLGAPPHARKSCCHRHMDAATPTRPTDERWARADGDARLASATTPS